MPGRALEGSRPTVSTKLSAMPSPAPRETGGADPQTWLLSATRLFYGAELLWDAAKRAEQAVFRGEPHHHAASDQHNIAFLLFGYAFENVLKGLIVHRLNTEGKTVVEGGKLKHVPKQHDLVALARDAKLPLEADETDLLIRLKAYVVWAGRYPIMLDASAYIRTQLVTSQHSSTDWPLAQRLFNKAIGGIRRVLARRDVVVAAESRITGAVLLSYFTRGRRFILTPRRHG